MNLARRSEIYTHKKDVIGKKANVLAQEKKRKEKVLTREFNSTPIAHLTVEGLRIK